MTLNKSNSPYGKGPFMNTTLRGTIIPIFLSIVASLSLQQAYLIPWCQSIAYQFYGHDLPPTWVFSLYLTLATLSILFCVWVTNRNSAQTGEPLFGEFHEDAIQTTLAFTGLCVGKAVGMPWNLTPLPILAFLGLSVWITSRMVRKYGWKRSNVWTRFSHCSVSAAEVPFDFSVCCAFDGSCVVFVSFCRHFL
jgi:hypothetical protein